MDINLNDLLRRYRSHPFEDYLVETPHTGLLTFKVKEGQGVSGPSGKWGQKPGTLLFLLERERNVKKIHSHCTGEVVAVRPELQGTFVEAREIVLAIRHRLGKEEIIDRILTQVLHIFPAPQTARYLLVPDLAQKLERPSGAREVTLEPGDEALIMSLMKRDTIIEYQGPPGVVFKVYFQSGAMVEQGEPLLGVCPPEKLEYVQKVIQRIRTEWED